MLRSSADRQREVEARVGFRRCLAESAEIAVAEASAPGVRGGPAFGANGEEASKYKVPGPLGACFVGVLDAIRRKMRKKKSHHSVHIDASEVKKTMSEKAASAMGAISESISASTSRPTLARSLFGTKVSKVSATERLQVASRSLDHRISAVDGKIKAARADAKQLMSQGEKSSAMRALKRSKVLESQMNKMTMASMAIERQMSLLEDVDLQSTIASAMNSGAKDVKRAKRALQGVDQAIDDASEVQDAVNDVHSAISSLVEGSFDDMGFDDDELAKELEQMSEPPPPPQGNPESIELSSSSITISEWPAAPTHSSQAHGVHAVSGRRSLSMGSMD